MKRLLSIGVILLIGGSFGSLRAQTQADNCRQTIDLAADQISHPRRVIGLLTGSGFRDSCYHSLSKGDRLRAHRLLAQAYLFLDPPLNDSALDSWEALLQTDPEYQLDTLSSSEEFISLSNQFLNRPLFAFSFLQGGIHLPLIRPRGAYTTANVMPGGNPDDFSARYRPELSWHLATAAWLNLHALIPAWPRLLRWEVGFDVRYQDSRHRYTQRWWWLNDAENRFETSFEEQQTSLGLGFGLRYSFDPRRNAYDALKRPLVPYLALGACWQRLLTATISDTRLTNQPGVDEVQALAEGIADPNILALRRSQAWAANVTLGAKYKIDRHYLFAELGIEHGLTNLVQSSHRYQQAQLLYQYGYVDPDWTATRLMLSLGFLFTQYQIKRRPDLRRPSLR